MPNPVSKITWPKGKRFAFTIVDDTDRATVENVRPVYDFLLEKQFMITKTVWPLAPLGDPIEGGESLEDQDYKEWVVGIKDRGAEIALHGISDESSTRERVQKGLSNFREIIGYDPRVHINHTGQAECVYWGEDRFDGIVKQLYRIARRRVLGKSSKFYGHVESSPYFWGDLCQSTVTFVRNMVFRDINTLKMDPLMPYHDPRRPYVPYWFSSSLATNVNRFCNLLSEANQDRLMEEGGACIVYTHLGFGFYRNGILNARFVELMSRLAGLPGWFVPVSELLGHVGDQRGWRDLTRSRKDLRRMERKWLLQKISRGKH
jgi:hypothetical protein